MRTEKFLRTIEKWYPNSHSPETELYRASMGFDFIFYLDKSGTRRISCIEVNQHDSGINGVRKIAKPLIDPGIRTLANIRSMVSPNKREVLRQCNAVEADLLASSDNIGEQDENKLKEKILEHFALSEKLIRIPLCATAIPTDPTLDIVLTDKRYHSIIVPEDLRPKIRTADESDYPASGFWIAKPVRGTGGRGIKIYGKDEFTISELPKLDGNYIWQEFLFPLPADEAPEDLKNNPASMRYLIDFVRYGDGHIEKLYEFAYQRISRYGADSSESFEDTYVVNTSRGANAVPASQHELDSARSAATRIIERISAHYPDYKLIYDKSAREAVAGIAEGGNYLHEFVEILKKL